MSSSSARVVAGRYALLQPLGSGGMGTVWRARDEVLGREVAVKEITFPPGLTEAEREVLRERTRREARAAARLDHPSAVTVFDVVEQDGSPYLVLELVEARSLAEVVRDDGPLEPARVASVGMALLGALEAAHAQGVLHRDVKPANVLVRDDGRVVLTDFGIATGLGDSSLTHTGLLVGSPSYIAPERARGEPAGPPSDLWSLGATLFCAVEGRAPYDAGEPLLTVSAVVSGEHAPFVLAGPLVPVLEGLLDKDPGRRLDAAATRARLQAIAASPAPSAPSAPPAPSPAPTAALPLPPGPVADPPPAARTAALRLDDVPVRPPPPARRPARPEFAPRRRSARVWVPATVATALLAGAGGALALALDDDRDPGAATSAGSPAASASASPTPTEPVPAEPEPTEPEPTEPAPTEPPAAEPAEPSSAPADDDGPATAGEGSAALPEGWTTDTSEAGWTVALPPGYAATRPGEYRDGAGRTLRIETGQGQPDAVADRRRQAAGFAERHPSYREIRIEAADQQGYPAADWEFTYEGLHVLNRVFVVDGTGHSLFLQYPRGDERGASDFAAIAERFTPVGG